jgi:hypothetical protein
LPLTGRDLAIDFLVLDARIHALRRSGIQAYGRFATSGNPLVSNG